MFPQGKEIIEHFIEVLRKENITEVPRWVEPTTKATAEICDDTEVKKEEESSEAESSSEESDLRERTSSTPSTGSTELHLGASAANIPNIEKINLNEGMCRKSEWVTNIVNLFGKRKLFSNCFHSFLM